MISAAFMAFYIMLDDKRPSAGIWTYGKILLIGEDKQKSVTAFVLIQHALEFFSCFDDTISIVGVDDEDDTLSVLEIVSPKRSNLVLPANIPHCELNVLVFDSLDVEACGRSVDRLADFGGVCHTDSRDSGAVSC